MLSSNTPSIAVLMATYNGAQYLNEQIDSILNQSLPPTTIIVSDDGSDDGTITILEKYAAVEKIKFIKNDTRRGVVGNFINCLHQLPAGYYFALSDQDDIWHPSKLEESFHALQKIEHKDQPCMVYSDLCLIDAQKNIINRSFRNELGHHKYKHCLETLLFGNFVLGCTTLCNYSLKDYIIGMPIHPSFNHDAWMALVSYTFGQTYSIDKALVDYRQHSSNVTIRTHNKKTVLNRYINHAKQLLSKNDFLEDRFPIVDLFYSQYKSSMTPQKRMHFEDFLALQNKSYLSKKIAFETAFYKHWTNRFS
ncbi:MAG: glycosyltransferase family 2 protein [Sediminibacterium sp.]|nr:glycosyltransferase family 2 protein [Sediminibacterium sp.]